MGTSHFSGPVESENGFTVGGVAQPVLGGTAQQLTATGAVSSTTNVLELAHATVVIAATLAQGPIGYFAVVNKSASGTVAHTVTLAAGSWDGTNNTLTTNAPAETVLIYFDSAGRGTILANNGVTFSTV